MRKSKLLPSIFFIVIETVAFFMYFETNAGISLLMVPLIGFNVWQIYVQLKT